MKIVTLVENTTCNTELGVQHGLSFYIETDGSKILFDCGADGLFLKNAKKLGVDIAAVDSLILSHGHSDHGGGIQEFLKANIKAKIYISKHAFGDYYFKVLFFKKYIGLDKALKNNSRIVFVDRYLMIDENTVIFSDITADKLRSAQSKLLKKENGKLFKDDFKHEQCLIVGDTLFAGCAHTGIVNIYEKAKRIKAIKHIFGGFHLYNPATKKTEDPTLVEDIAGELADEDIKIYTGHCTGKMAFEIMKPILGDKIKELSTGKIYEI